MENETNQQELLAKNLAYYRKASGLTQLELAEKFNYSDKSVLKSLADFYGITVDDFYATEHKKITVKQSQKRKQIYIRLLSLGICWLVVVLTFFLLNVLLPKDAKFQTWLTFVYGTLASSIIWLVWEFIYHNRFYRMIATSLVIWTAALSLYLTFLLLIDNYPLIFVVAAPLQVLEILWYLFRRKKDKAGN